MDTSSPRLVGGRYALLSRLGAGGMGTVWRARDEVLGREVAVKEVTFPHGVSDEDRDVLRERTRREARAAARLDHPSAVTVYDVVEHDGAPYLVMELVEARTLADVVRADGPLPPHRTAQVGLALLGALEAAHAQGIVHRDVKPSNVMVRDDGRVVLTDFGIATSTGDPSITSTGLLLGSPAYISPERASGSAPGPAADLWALGATLFTAVEGRPPFDQEDALSTMMAVMTGEHGPFVLAGPLEPVLDGLLVKDPAERLDARSARAMLQSVADRPATDRTAVLTRPVPPAGGAAGGAAGAAAAAAAGLGAAAVAAGRPASRTTALDVGDLRSEAAAAGPAAAPATAPRPAPRPLPPVRPLRTADRPAGRPGWLLPVAGAAALLIAVGGGVALSSGGLDEVLGREDAAGSAPADPAAEAPAEEAPAGEAPADGTTDEQAAQQAEEARKAEEEARKAAEEQAKAEQEAAEEAAEQEGEGEDSGGDGGGGGAAGGLPEGWTTDTGGAGWTVALPPGYARTGNGVYRTPDRRTLRVESGPGQPDAVADRQAQARSFASRHPTYREIRIDPVDYRGYEAADWEFTFEGVRVLNRVFVVDGVGHSLWLQAPEGAFGTAVQDFDAIAAAFQPVGG